MLSNFTRPDRKIHYIRDMPKRISYLLGAGASAEKLPCIDGILERFIQFRLFMETYKPRDIFFSSIGDNEKEIFSEYLRELKSFEEKIPLHASVDTYAKKLYITKSSKYEVVKAILSAFFIYEQARQPVDLRYDAFIASVINSSRRMPDHMNVVSWNYDCQFEKAFSQYSSNDDIFENQSHLNVISNKNIIEPSNGFSIFKVNGTIEWLNEGSPHIHYPLYQNLNEYRPEDFKRLVVLNYADLAKTGRLNCSLSFSWERDRNAKTINAATDALMRTEILIIIGYSFPFFNREIDRLLFDSMSSLEKIYVQDKDPGQVIAKLETFSSLERFNPVPVDQVKAFHLPKEL